MFIYNYHTHTSRCGHAFGTDEEYVLAAIKAGYKVLGFSDHAPYHDYPLPGIHMDWECLDDYVESITFLKEKYKDQIDIHLGLETEYFPENHSEKIELLDKVDYLLLGQHFASPSGSPSFFRNNTEEEIADYARFVCTALDTGLFTYLCHPDVFMCKQEEFTPLCAEVAHTIARKCVETNTPVELNIHGVMKGLHHFPDGKKYYYPHRDFWKIMAEYPLKVAVGIDAHDPAELLDFKSIQDGLKEVEDLNLNFITEPFIGI